MSASAPGTAITAPWSEQHLKEMQQFAGTICFKMLELDYANIPSLSIEEQQCLSERATPERRAQFAFGRAAAKSALHELGLSSDISIAKGKNREPIFPASYLGSISHSSKYALAAVGRLDQLCGMGIDLEDLHSQVDHKVITRITTAPESDWALAVPDKTSQRLLAIFSAKESIYKTLSPVLGRYIGFSEVTLHWNEESQSFSIACERKLSEELKPYSLAPLWVSVKKDLVCSCALLKKL